MKIAKHRTILYIAIGLVAILIIGGTTACAKKPETPAALLSLGEKYLTELDYENAIVQFLKVIEIEPMNVRAYAALAEIYTKTEQSGKAVTILEKGILATGDESLKQELDLLRELPESPEEQTDAGEEIGGEAREAREADNRPDWLRQYDGLHLDPTPEQQEYVNRVCVELIAENYGAVMQLICTQEMVDILRSTPLWHGAHMFMYQYDNENSWFRFGFEPDDVVSFVTVTRYPETGNGIYSDVVAYTLEQPSPHTFTHDYTYRTAPLQNYVPNGNYEVCRLDSPGGALKELMTVPVVDGLYHGKLLRKGIGGLSGDLVTTEQVYENGLLQILGPPNEEGDVPTSIRQDTGEFSYTSPDSRAFTTPDFCAVG